LTARPSFSAEKTATDRRRSVNWMLAALEPNHIFGVRRTGLVSANKL
jgi:hypothetical protein